LALIVPEFTSVIEPLPMCLRLNRLLIGQRIARGGSKD